MKQLKENQHLRGRCVANSLWRAFGARGSFPSKPNLDQLKKKLEMIDLELGIHAGRDESLFSSLSVGFI